MAERNEFETRLQALREVFGDLSDGPGILAAPATLGTLRFAEVADARATADDLFRKSFHADVPAFPRHFVLLPEGGAGGKAIGYVHYTRAGPIYLGGGLVVSAMDFRRLDRPTAELVREAGGLAEWLMRNAHAALEGEAVFGYVGDALALRVDLRVGYEPTDHSRVYGLWRPGVSPERRRWLAERVAAFGPF